MSVGDSDEPGDEPGDEIGRRAARKRRAREHPGPSPLLGLGAFGVIGWSIAVPTVAGAFAGAWLDRVVPRDFSWTLALILGGVSIGALIAWAWVADGDER